MSTFWEATGSSLFFFGCVLIPSGQAVDAKINIFISTARYRIVPMEKI